MSVDIGIMGIQKHAFGCHCLLAGGPFTELTLATTSSLSSTEAVPILDPAVDLASPGIAFRLFFFFFKSHNPASKYLPWQGAHSSPGPSVRLATKGKTQGDLHKK